MSIVIERTIKRMGSSFLYGNGWLLPQFTCCSWLLSNVPGIMKEVLPITERVERKGTAVMSDEKKESQAFIVRPPTYSTVPTKQAGRLSQKNMKAPRRAASKRKKYKKAKRVQRGALHLKRVFAGFTILLVMITGFYFFTNPSAFNNLKEGRWFDKTEDCTVTQVNATNFFETSCGQFEWAIPDSAPSSMLGEGQMYRFQHHGFAIPIAGKFPEVTAVGPVQ